MYPSTLTEEQWQRLAPLIVKPRNTRGRPPRTDFRAEINAILYVMENGCEWPKLPEGFPYWRNVYGYFRRWRQDGSLHRIMETLRETAGNQPAV